MSYKLNILERFTEPEHSNVYIFTGEHEHGDADHNESVEYFVSVADVEQFLLDARALECAEQNRSDWTDEQAIALEQMHYIEYEMDLYWQDCIADFSLNTDFVFYDADGVGYNGKLT